MLFLGKFFSSLARLGFGAIALVLIPVGVLLAYQVDVAVNMLLGGGYVAYIVLLIALAMVLIRSLLVNNSRAAIFLLVPVALLLLMVFGRAMLLFKLPFFERTMHTGSQFFMSLLGPGSLTPVQYGVIFLFVLGISIISAVLARICQSVSRGFGMPFGKPAWQGDNVARALKCVQQETDQERLKEIVAKAPLHATSMASLGKITDQSYLMDIMRKAGSSEMRSRAVRNIADQQYLMNVARSDKDKYVRESAVSRIADQGALAVIAKTDLEWIVGITAVRSLKEQDLLADIAKHAFDRRMSDLDIANVTTAAVRELTDQNLIADVAKNASCYYAKMEAVACLTNPNLLADIVKSTDNPKFGKDALEKLTDQSLIADVAKNALDSGIRLEAMKRLDDPNTLADITMSDSAGAVSSASAKQTDISISKEDSPCGKNEEGHRIAGCKCEYCGDIIIEAAHTWAYLSTSSHDGSGETVYVCTECDLKREEWWNPYTEGIRYKHDRVKK